MGVRKIYWSNHDFNYLEDEVLIVFVECTYLDSIIRDIGDCIFDVKSRIDQASAVFENCKSNMISKNTKFKILEATS